MAQHPIAAIPSIVARLVRATVAVLSTAIMQFACTLKTVGQWRVRPRTHVLLTHRTLSAISRWYLRPRAGEIEHVVELRPRSNFPTRYSARGLRFLRRNNKMIYSMMPYVERDQIFETITRPPCWLRAQAQLEDFAKIDAYLLTYLYRISSWCLRHRFPSCWSAPSPQALFVSLHGLFRGCLVSR